MFRPPPPLRRRYGPNGGDDRPGDRRPRGSSPPSCPPTCSTPTPHPRPCPRRWCPLRGRRRRARFRPRTTAEPVPSHRGSSRPRRPGRTPTPPAPTPPRWPRRPPLPAPIAPTPPPPAGVAGPAPGHAPLPGPPGGPATPGPVPPPVPPGMPAPAAAPPPPPGAPGPAQLRSGTVRAARTPPVVDPHGLGLAAPRLGGGARRAGKVAFGVLATVLRDGDGVAVVVQGRFRGEPAVAALVEGRVVVVNDRQWKPDVVELPVDAEPRRPRLAGRSHGRPHLRPVATATRSSSASATVVSPSRWRSASATPRVPTSAAGARSAAPAAPRRGEPIGLVGAPRRPCYGVDPTRTWLSW